MLEIQKTFDFFKATASSDRIDRIMLSGGASRAEGFTEMLSRAVRGAGRAVRSVQEGRVRREEVQGRVAPPTSRRPWRSRSGSRCAGWATDDSHQPAGRRARSATKRPRAASSRPPTASPSRATLILLSTVARRRLVVLVAAHARRIRLDEDIAAAETETQQLRSVLGAGAEVRDAQGAAAAARHAHRAAAARPVGARCTCSTRSARRIPDRLWLTR